MQKNIVTIGVNSLEESTKFYSEVLDFKVDHTFSPNDDMVITFLSNETGLNIELIESKQRTDIDNSNSSITLTFQVKNIEMINQKLNDIGIPFDSIVLPNGLKFARFYDPNKLAISFVEEV